MQTLLLIAALAGAGPADDPGAFVDGLYAYYATSDPGPRGDEEVYTAEIVSLFARQQTLAGPDEVVRDGDDICQCQDWENLRLVSREVHPAGDSRAEVDVRFENFGQPYRARLVLARTGNGWRVADIADYYEGQGLVATLRAGIAEVERSQRR
jgi:hypothetical protein